MKFCPECGKRVYDQPYCPSCGIELTKFYAPNEVDEDVEEISPRERRERILADFDVSNHAIVRYRGKGGKVVVPEGIVAIHENAFYRCGVVNEVILPASIREIGDKAFFECNALKQITFSEDLEVIGEKAFCGCAFSGSITFPKKLKAIGKGAFDRCRYLERAVLPASLKTIGVGAFASCSSLTEIDFDGKNDEFSTKHGVLYNKNFTSILCYPSGKADKTFRLPDKVIKIEQDAFYGNELLQTLLIGANVKDIHLDALLCCASLKRIKVSSLNRQYSSLNGMLLNKDRSVLLYIPPELEESVLSLPYSVKEIADNCAVGAKNVKAVLLHDEIQKVGYNAFYGCIALEEVVVEGNNPYYSDNEGVLFNKSGTALLLYPAGRKKSYYEVPAYVKVIGKTAFAFAQYLTSIILPENITVSEYAFHRCDVLAYAYVHTNELQKFNGVFPPTCVVTDR